MWLSECAKKLSERNQQRKKLLTIVLINELQQRKRRNYHKKCYWVNPIFMNKFIILEIKNNIFILYYNKLN